MGNCPACLSSELVHHSNEPEEEGEAEEMVRVLRTTDNELFEFPGPVFVKDLLFGFQGFAVFPNKAHKKKQQPLHPNTLLKFSHIYYLKPWILPSTFLNPLVNHDTNYKNLLFLAKHTSAKPWLPLINPLITPNNEVNQPLINSLNPSFNPLSNTDKYLNTSNNNLNNSTENNYLLNDGDDPLKQVIMSSAKPPILINELVGDLSAINAPDSELNELAGDLIAENSEDKALNELQGALLEPTEKLITINVQDQSALSELAESLITINAQDQRAFNELADDLMTLNAEEGPLNQLAEGFIKINSQQKSSSDFLMESPSKQGKVMKKVRFAEEVVLITSSNRLVNHAAVAPPSLSFCGSGGERNTHSYASISGGSGGGGGEWNMHACASISKDDEQSTHSHASNEERVSQFNKQTACMSASKEGLIPYISKKEINGVVRLKVVISKKQLTELMSPRASDKESDALVEKMLSPLLSPTSSSHKSDSLKNGVFHSPPWRPSLNHIPEDISCQELI